MWLANPTVDLVVACLLDQVMPLVSMLVILAFFPEIPCPFFFAILPNVLHEVQPCLFRRATDESLMGSRWARLLGPAAIDMARSAVGASRCNGAGHHCLELLESVPDSYATLPPLPGVPYSSLLIGPYGRAIVPICQLSRIKEIRRYYEIR